MRHTPAASHVASHAASQAASHAASPSASKPPVRGAWAVMRAVVFALMLREAKTRLGGRWSGAAWTVGEPLTGALLILGLYSLVRAHALGGVDTLMFLVTGMLPFQLFKSLVLRSMEGIDANQGLFAYRQVRPIDAVLARVAVEVAINAAILAATVLVLAWLGHAVLPARPLELLAASLLLIGVGTAFGLVVAVATDGVFARARAVVRVGFFPLSLASGVLFPIASLPAALREPLLANPMLHLIEGVRGAFFGAAYRATPETTLAVPAAWLLGAAALGTSLYRLRRDQLRTA